MWLALLRLIEFVMYMTHVTLCAGCLRGDGNDCTEVCTAAASCVLLQSHKRVYQLR